jgi:hypothetical protein
LVDDGFDRPSYLDASWLRQFQPAAAEARSFLERGGVPALARLSRCSVVDGAGYRLLDAECMRSGLGAGWGSSAPAPARAVALPALAEPLVR